MKKSYASSLCAVLLFASLLLDASKAHAQDDVSLPPLQTKYTEYANLYVDKSYPIRISAAETDTFTVYIEALDNYSLSHYNPSGKMLDKNTQYDITHATVSLSHYGGLFLEDGNQHQSFVRALSNARAKYIEWTGVAETNSVKELSKQMKVESNVGAYFIKNKKWVYLGGVDLSFEYKIISDGAAVHHLLIINSGELESSANRFDKSDGFVIVLSSKQEIDDFIKAVSEQSVNEFRKKPQTAALFKD